MFLRKTSVPRHSSPILWFWPCGNHIYLQFEQGQHYYLQHFLHVKQSMTDSRKGSRANCFCWKLLDTIGISLVLARDPATKFCKIVKSYFMINNTLFYQNRKLVKRGYFFPASIAVRRKSTVLKHYLDLTRDFFAILHPSITRWYQPPWKNNDDPQRIDLTTVMDFGFLTPLGHLATVSNGANLMNSLFLLFCFEVLAGGSLAAPVRNTVAIYAVTTS